jgi:hypothetical protein
MAAPQVTLADDVETWVEVTNDVGVDLGDAAALTIGASVVAGVNGLDAAIGNLATLQTVDQSSMVAAINEAKDTAFVMALVLATPLN